MDLEKLKFSILIIKHNNMKKTSFLILLSLSVSFFCSGKKSAVDYVNPMIGTALKGEGGTSPFVGTPFAMTEFMPQTRENKRKKHPSFDGCFLVEISGIEPLTS